jgi:hypothetical protein
MRSNTAFIVTAYAMPSNKPENVSSGDFCLKSDEYKIKRHMTTSLCKYLKETSDHMVVLASHSPISEETQQYCDLVIYDKDNSFQVNGIPKCFEEPFERRDPRTTMLNAGYGIAEFTSLHNAINALNRFKHITHFFKLPYDSELDIDWNSTVEKCHQTKKKMVSAQPRTLEYWSRFPIKKTLGKEPEGEVGTVLFLCEIEFFKKTLSLENDLHLFDEAPVKWIECVWYDSIKQKGLLDEVEFVEIDSAKCFFGTDGGGYFGEGVDSIIAYPF